MFELRNLIKTAFRSIFKNRMRSLLTSLGIIIGVAAVVVMVAIGQGAQTQIRGQITSLGTDLLIIFPGTSRFGGVSRGAGSAQQFTMADVDRLRKQATLLRAVTPIIRVEAQVIGNGRNWSTTIMGVSPSYPVIRAWNLKFGRFFSEQDVIARRKVAVVGETVADSLFPGEDPIGHEIRIRNIPFTIIGELQRKGQSIGGQNQDDVVLAPSTTVLYHLKGGNYIDFIMASAVSEAEIYNAQAQVTTIMRQAHHLQRTEPNDFTVRNQEDFIKTAQSTTQIFTILLGSIAAISLIVGGIGIMNIMLVSVTERTREIGIRLSVGARGSDILTQFLSEAVVLSLGGGFVGIIVSLIVAYLIGHFTPLMTVVSPGIMLLAVSFSALVGIFFGLHPARKAAALNPIDALRYE
jgi:putative ABC transport system permease protein